MKYPIITICGSLRAGKEVWDKVAHCLSLEGYIVITVHVWEWKALHKGDLLEEKEMLDEMHKQRIEMSDGIYVINVLDGKQYIGKSTTNEIEHAQKLGRFIKYHSLNGSARNKK